MLQAHLHFEVEGALGSSHVLFPRVVDQLSAVTNVTEFHLTLTQGRWVSRLPYSALCCTTCLLHMQYIIRLNIRDTIHASILQHASRWGRAIVPAPPAGAQLRAQFRQGLSQEVSPHTLDSRGSRPARLGARDVKNFGSCHSGCSCRFAG